MQVEFVTASKTGAQFAVGHSFMTATTGDKLMFPEGQRITIPYPLSLFVTFFNTGSSGELLITYKYIDQEPEDAESLQGALWQIEDTKGKYSTIL